MSQDRDELRARRARVIRSAILLGLTALAIYVVFIMLVAERSQGVT